MGYTESRISSFKNGHFLTSRKPKIEDGTHHISFKVNVKCLRIFKLSSPVKYKHVGKYWDIYGYYTYIIRCLWAWKDVAMGWNLPRPYKHVSKYLVSMDSILTLLDVYEPGKTGQCVETLDIHVK